MKKRNWKAAGAIAVSLILGVNITSCGLVDSVGHMITVLDAIDNIQKEYDSATPYTYDEPVNDVERNHSFRFEIKFDTSKVGQDVEATDWVNVYQDPDLSHPVQTSFQIDKTGGKKVLVMSPGSRPAMSIFNEDSFSDSSADTLLYDKGENADWGNLPEYYLVQKIDFKTGKKLKKPKVTIFTVKTELPDVHASFTQDENGNGGFTWDKVEGADTYYIVKKSYDEKEDFWFDYGMVVAETKDTSWFSAPDSEEIANMTFRSYKYSEDDRNSFLYQDQLDGEENINEDHITNYYAVIAAGKEGTSHAAMFNEKDGIISLLPYSVAEALMNSKDGTSLGAIDQIENLPGEAPVVMCDGSIVYKVVDYDTSKGVAKDGSLSIPWTITGTPFQGTVLPLSYDEKQVPELLKWLDEREQELLGNTGGVEPEVQVETEEADQGQTDQEQTEQQEAQQQETEKQEAQQQEKEKLKEDFPIPLVANTALSKYLALSMMNGVEDIDLSAFSESYDTNQVMDAYNEAYYQNVLIMGLDISSIRYYSGSRIFHVSYMDSPADREKKRNQAVDEAKKALGSIIKDGMSARDKAFAINDYLCSTVTYNQEAYENLKANNGYPDVKYADAWTPYGALVEKTCVCGGYAATFKLMCQLAGVDAIVVDGYLDGDPNKYHVWNRVNLDGQWMTVDVTNNDQDTTYSALMNLPDDLASRVLVENDRYLTDSLLGTYKASGDGQEYYHAKGLYYGLDTVTQAVADQLQQNGVARLRTDFNLTQDQYMQIVQGAADLTGRSNYGYYWLGVLYIYYV